MSANKAAHTAAIFSVRSYISVPPLLSNRGRPPAKNCATLPKQVGHVADRQTVEERQPYARHTLESTMATPLRSIPIRIYLLGRFPDAKINGMIHSDTLHYCGGLHNNDPPQSAAVGMNDINRDGLH